MKLKFMSEPPLDARLLSCADCGEEKHIWIHSQQERRLRYSGQRANCKPMAF
jgi:hypothetical protein